MEQSVVAHKPIHKRIMRWLAAIRAELRKTWWGVPILLVVGFVGQMIYARLLDKANQFVDARANLGWVRTALMFLAKIAALTPSSLWRGLLFGLVFCLIGFFVLVAHAYWETRPAKRQDEALVVELIPSSGPGQKQYLSVTNKDKKQKFHATCKLLERRGDPNSLNTQTYDLSWERNSWRILTLATGESCNLLIATVEPVPNSDMLETKLKGFSNRVVTDKEWNRWGGQWTKEKPEYDLEITVFGESGFLAERFTLKCGGKIGALEMHKTANLPSHFPERGDYEYSTSSSRADADGSIHVEMEGGRQIDRRPQMWEYLAARFKELPFEPIRIWGEWIYTNETKQYQWWVRHPSEVGVKMCIELCKEAGRLLLAEPRFRVRFPDVSAVLDDGDRWLLAVYKVSGIGKLTATGTSASYGVLTTSEGGEIKDLSGASQVLCQMARNGF